MTTQFPAGFHAALTTPLTQGGDVDADAVEQLVRNARSQLLDGLYVGGSTGEGLLLPVEVRAEMLNAVAEAAKGDFKLIAQVGSLEVSAAERIAKAASDAGFDEVSSTPPFYFRHSDEELKTYYKDLQRACGLPMVLYNIPGMTSVNLPNRFFIELAEEMDISGIKYTSQDIVQLVGLLDQIGDIPVYYGVDEMLAAGLSVGSHGAIGSTFNLLGREYRELANSLATGDLESVARIQAKANRFIEVLVSIGMPLALKACLEIRGISGGTPARPFQAVSKEDMTRLEQALADLDSE